MRLAIFLKVIVKPTIYIIVSAINTIIYGDSRPNDVSNQFVKTEFLVDNVISYGSMTWSN